VRPPPPYATGARSPSRSGVERPFAATPVRRSRSSSLPSSRRHEPGSRRRPVPTELLGRGCGRGALASRKVVAFFDKACRFVVGEAPVAAPVDGHVNPLCRVIRLLAKRPSAVKQCRRNGGVPSEPTPSDESDSRFPRPRMRSNACAHLEPEVGAVRSRRFTVEVGEGETRRDRAGSRDGGSTRCHR